MNPIYHDGAICALEFYESKLYSGEGPNLCIYDYANENLTKNKLFERKIIPKNKIHGIKFNRQQYSDSNNEDDIIIAIWGGRSLIISKLSDLKDENYKIKELFVGDWIMTCEFSNCGKKLYVLNAHNCVTTINIEFLNNLKIESENHCNEKSILYSGTIRVLKNNKILICAGTVMSGILLWELNSCKLLHNLTGHEGSIFGVKASNDGKYLVSCSDDRSIKIWDIESGENLATGWGHGARIWSLDFYTIDNNNSNNNNNNNNEIFRIFSASEDCTARVWSFKSNDSNLECYNIYDSHTGRNIWSSAINYQYSIAATGGADGRIKLYDLNETKRDGYFSNEWDNNKINDMIKISNSIDDNISFEKNELIKEYFDFLNNTGLISITNEGKILTLNNNYQNWNFLFQDNDFKKFSIINGFKNEKIVVIGSKIGKLILLKFNDDLNIIDKREIQLEGLNSNLNNILTCKDNNRLIIYIETPNPRDNFKIIEINDTDIHNTINYDLVKPDTRFVSSCICFDSKNSWLVIGSRYTTFILYSLNNNNGNTTIENKPLKLWKKFYPGDTISSVQIIKSDINQIYILMTLRDGDYMILKIDEKFNIEFIQENRVQKGFLEGCFINELDGDLITYGFKSSLFYIWNETKQFEILKIYCGGAHRQWSFNHYYTTTKNNTNKFLQFRFIYTRASDIYLLNTGIPPFLQKSYLKPGFHGREIRSLDFSPKLYSNNNSSNNSRLLLSGAEDTTIKLSSFNSNGEFEVYWSQRKHVSGIQSIKFINENFAITSAAREELFLWKIESDLKFEKINKPFISCFAVLPPTSANPDLRIMDFDVINVTADEKSIGFVMVTVYSDSAIRLWYFNYESKKFTLISEGEYKTCCILNTNFIVVDRSIYILISATDGHLTLWNIDSTLKNDFKLSKNSKSLVLNNKDTTDIVISEFSSMKLLINQQIHQSGIKDMALRFIDPIEDEIAKIDVITGGDDNALGITSFIFNKQKSEVNCEISSFVPDAASSTITSVSLTTNSQAVLVTSVDQVLKKWSIDDSNLELLEEKYTTIADTGCSTVTEIDGSEVALVGGSGFSIWKL
ncbi:hypothetical protein B5S28_g1922 [[Candida] boidinii]|nr:hypothetical protein B5S28_g1922 [[Candida] boidinii]OWB62255.1 hypothetical protein B5S29_g3178 [[Candida] boidinii]